LFLFDAREQLFSDNINLGTCPAAEITKEARRRKSRIAAAS